MPLAKRIASNPRRAARITAKLAEQAMVWFGRSMKLNPWGAYGYHALWLVPGLAGANGRVAAVL